jgi:hypothetical protein
MTQLTTSFSESMGVVHIVEKLCFLLKQAHTGLTWNPK